MADQDTDRWIFEVLAPDLRRKMENLEDEFQWTDLVSVLCCLYSMEMRSQTSAGPKPSKKATIEASLKNKSFMLFVLCPLLVTFSLNTAPYCSQARLAPCND